MKKALVVAVGESKEPIVRFFNKKSGYDTIYFFCSKETKNVADETSKLISKIFNDVKLVLIDPYDINDILSKIINLSKNQELEFNITGGTKLICIALFFSSILIDAPCYYVTPNDELISLPNINHNIFMEKTSLKRFKILSYLEENKRSLSEIASFLKVTKQTAEAHLLKLLKQDLIKKEICNKECFFEITLNGRLYLNVLRLSKKG